MFTLFRHLRFARIGARVRRLCHRSVSPCGVKRPDLRYRLPQSYIKFYRNITRLCKAEVNALEVDMYNETFFHRIIDQKGNEATSALETQTSHHVQAIRAYEQTLDLEIARQQQRLKQLRITLTKFQESIDQLTSDQENDDVIAHTVTSPDNAHTTPMENTTWLDPQLHPEHEENSDSLIEDIPPIDTDNLFKPEAEVKPAS